MTSTHRIFVLHVYCFASATTQKIFSHYHTHSIAISGLYRSAHKAMSQWTLIGASCATEPHSRGSGSWRHRVGRVKLRAPFNPMTCTLALSSNNKSLLQVISLSTLHARLSARTLAMGTGAHITRRTTGQGVCAAATSSAAEIAGY